MQVPAKNLINYNRLDLIVKYLYAREILERENNDYTTNVYKDLYIRHILMRNMGIEPLRDYEPNNKNCVDDFCNDFENLVIDIKNKGYDINKPVKIGKNNLPENGAHRISISALLDQEIPVEIVEHGWEWNFNWFCENGFNTYDKQRILKGFVDIHPEKCAIFVVWNPLFNYIDNVKAVLKKYFNIVGDVDLDFENNYIAFTNMLLEIYEPNISKNGDETVIREKSKILQANYLNFKVIVVTNQDKNADKSISDLTKACKSEIRNIFDHILPKECFCTVHSSDGEDECRYLANILLSPNNIKHLEMRLSTEYNIKFVRKIRNLSNFLPSIGIFNSNEICIIGSGVMTALGIPKDSDSDFITDSKHRERLGWKSVHLNDDYDIGVSDVVAQRTKNIPDNILIYNSEYHFWFKGIKFANLEIIKDRKLQSQRPKDIIHLREIDLYEKMLGHRNQQKMLMERIEAEKVRRLNIQQPQTINTKAQYSNSLEKLFSVKNEYSNNKKYKVITIAGIKTKFKVIKNSTIEK